jgi:hypothetical protein
MIWSGVLGLYGAVVQPAVNGVGAATTFFYQQMQRIQTFKGFVSDVGGLDKTIFENMPQGRYVAGAAALWLLGFTKQQK